MAPEITINRRFFTTIGQSKCLETLSDFVIYALLYDVFASVLLFHRVESESQIFNFVDGHGMRETKRGHAAIQKYRYACYLWFSSS